MRKNFAFISIKVFVIFLSFLFASFAIAESGPMTHKPKGEAPPTKVDQMQELLPDLVVSEIFEDSAGNIIVKIRNIGRGYINESAYVSPDKYALILLEINKKGQKIPLATIDSSRALCRPGGEVIWNTGKKTEGNRTEVIVRLDITNVINESVESNNQLSRIFEKLGMVGIDLVIVDLKKNSNEYSYYAEIQNKGNRSFNGTIHFEVWFKDYAHGNTWKRVPPPYLSLINSNNVFDSKLEIPAMQITCRNVSIPPYEIFSTNAISQCGVNYLFKVTPQPPDIGVEVKIKFSTDSATENKGNNEFIMHIRR